MLYYHSCSAYEISGFRMAVSWLTRQDVLNINHIETDVWRACTTACVNLASDFNWHRPTLSQPFTLSPKSCIMHDGEHIRQSACDVHHSCSYHSRCHPPTAPVMVALAPAMHRNLRCIVLNLTGHININSRTFCGGRNNSYA